VSLSVNILIILIYVVAIFVIYHSIKFRGVFKTLLFLLGALIITAGIENINVTFGGYEYPEGGITFLIYKCPIWVVLGWYVIVYCSNFASHILIKQGKGSLYSVGIGTAPENGVKKDFIKLTIIRAVFTAYAAILIDLLMDPVGIANGWWVWKVSNIYIHGIPFGNYIGWFFVIFFMVFFYEILITWSSVEEKKEITTAGLWAVASVAAMFFAGLILMGFTLWFGIEGIRTDERIYLMHLIMQVDWMDIIISGIFIIISMGITLAVSLVPNKTPESRPTSELWFILPSILMLIFWAVMLISAFFTSSLLVAVGIVECIPLLFIHLYLISKRGKIS